MWFWHILVKKIWFQRGLELIKKNHLQRFGLRYCYGQNNKRNWVTLYPRNISMTCVSSRANCVKSVQIRNYFWSVFSSIRTEYGEIRTRNNSVFGHFSRSDIQILAFPWQICLELTGEGVKGKWMVILNNHCSEWIEPVNLGRYSA